MTRSAILAVLLSLPPGAALAADLTAPARSTDGNLERTLSFGARGGATVGNGGLILVKRYQGGSSSIVRRQQLMWEASGATIAPEVGIRFAPAWTLFAGYEFGRMTADHAGTVTFFSHAPHLGVRLVTNRRRSVGFVLEMGAGYRILSIDRGPIVHTTMGFEPFRAGVGITVLATRGLRVNVMAAIAVGQFTRLDASGACANDDASRCQEISGGERRLHAFRSLTLGGTFDL